MKKILLIGILTLSALSFAATTTPTQLPVNSTTNKVGEMNHNMSNMPMNHNMDNKSGNAVGGCSSNMTPEMKKSMEEKGMMKDGKCVMMQNMMNNADSNTTATQPKK